MNKFNKYINGKTLKREVAVLFLGVTCYFGITGDSVMAEIFIGPATLFAAAAFGLDSAAKQLNMGRRNQIVGDVETNINIGNRPNEEEYDVLSRHPVTGRPEP